MVVVAMTKWITWRQVVTLIGIFACTATVIAFTEQSAIDKRLTQVVRVWERDFAAAFANEDWLLVRKLAVNLRSEGVSRLTLSMHGEEVFESPMQPGVNSCWLELSIPIQRYGIDMGELRACLSVPGLLQAALFNRWLLPVTALLACAIGLAAAYPLRRYKRSLTETVRLLRGWAVEKNDSLHQLAADDPLVTDLIQLVQGGVRREVESEGERARQRSLAELADLAAQVAHDVRSPLTALDVVASQAGNLPEETRVLLRMATGRVQAIAHQLLSRYDALQKPPQELARPSPPEPRCAWVLAVARQIISEKRALAGESAAPRLQLHVGDKVYESFVDMPATKLGQCLSNLLGNALEAIGPTGEVHLELDATDTHVQMLVRDDGPGIEPALLARLGRQPGVTEGKKNGHGLGLFYARCAAKNAGGDLILRSAVGEGTEVNLLLPRMAPPAWFAASVALPTQAEVVVVDDDPAIHAVWRNRLQDRDDLAVHHLESLQALRSWCDAHDSAQAIFLIDHDFRGEQQTGLDLIRALNLAGRSILVSSRADLAGVQERCLKMSLRLIPKSVVAWVPIAV